MDWGAERTRRANSEERRGRFVFLMDTMKLLLLVSIATCVQAIKFTSLDEERFTPEAQAFYFGIQPDGQAPGGALGGSVNVNAGFFLWTNQAPVNGKYQIPYVFDSNFLIPVQDRAGVFAAFNDFTAAGLCLEFVPRTTEFHYISFQHAPGDTGCWSYVGRLSSRNNPINLGSAFCRRKGTVIHEIMHALGFIHEHQRPDRDDYVLINQQVAQNGNWRKAAANDINSNGVPYDYRSIMHYHGYAGSPNQNTPMITLLDGSDTPIPNNDDMRPSDITQIGLLYGCAGLTTTTTASTPPTTSTTVTASTPTTTSTTTTTASTPTTTTSTTTTTASTPTTTSTTTSTTTTASTPTTTSTTPTTASTPTTTSTTTTTASTPTASTTTTTTATSTNTGSTTTLPPIVLNCPDEISREQCQIYMRKGWHLTRPSEMKNLCDGTANLCECDDRNARACGRRARETLTALGGDADESHPNENRCAKRRFQQRCRLSCGLCETA